MTPPQIDSAAVAWRDVEAAAPGLAGRVQALFDARKHKTIATLRVDGSPRISGIECEFVDGELRIGSMAGSRKGADLRRDPRFALHSPTVDPEKGQEASWPGEAKIAGRAVPAGTLAADPDEGGPDGEAFLVEVTEVVITHLNDAGTMLVIESWTPGRGLRVVERA